MRIPSTPRRTGARNRPVHFSYVPTERGQPWEAYIAGPTWWGFLHMTKPSKPCVYEITGGQVPCRFCGVGRAPVAVMKGWVPVYRRVDTLACMVPVDESLRDGIDALEFGAKVQVGRAKGKGVGVWVQPCINQEPKWTSTLPERSAPADVTESLLTVWKLPEVSAYFGRAPQSDNAVSLDAPAPAPALEEKPAPNDPGRQGRAPVPPAVGGAVDEAARRMLARLSKGERSANGNGRYPKLVGGDEPADGV